MKSTPAISTRLRIRSLSAIASMVAVTLAVVAPIGLHAIEPVPADNRPVIGLKFEGPIKVVYQITSDDMKEGVNEGLFYLKRVHQQYVDAGVDASRLDIKAVFHSDASTSILTARVIACALFATVASTSAAFAGSAVPLISEKAMEWRTDLDAALADAASTDRNVLLRFTATWCAPCRVMDVRVWPDPTVQAALAENYIIVKSDIDEESSQLLARKYGVRGVPTLLLLDSAGKEISRAGFLSSPETVKFLKTTGAEKDLP